MKQRSWFIAGVRHRVKADMDVRRTAIFTAYALRYLQIFAFVGAFFGVMIAVDYFLPQVNIKAQITGKERDNRGNHIYFGQRYSVTVNVEAFNNLPTGGLVDIYRTSVFATPVKIEYRGAYVGAPFNIYCFPPLFFVCMSGCLSFFLLLKNCPDSGVKRDTLISAGILNVIACLHTLAYLLL
ncbi:MAG: hypothetical protein LBS09_04200 [Bacteroidales bacterium]|jgi:hypothetical protein|nr:hypothetical protein [Bacteroidales bacterium]